jgi:hypothetical protein
MAGRRAARVTLVLVAVLWMASVGTVGGVATTPTASDAAAGTAPAAAPSGGGAVQPTADTATTRVTVYPNGTAVWSVEIRTALTNETDRADYRQFQAAFENDTARYLGPFRERMTRLVGVASNVTGRPMVADDFTATTRIQQTPREWGIVEYRFRWEGFAATDDAAVAVGDVFESGYYLAAGDSLVVEAPDGYRIETARPDSARRENGTVRWRGPLDFADRRPSVRLVPADTGGETPTPPTTGTATDGAAPAEGGDPVGPLLASLALVLLAGSAYAAVRRVRSPDTSAGTADDGGEAPDTGATGPAGTPPDDLVTDEERVVDLLAANDGRMRQADIADRLDWSAPKTSRVLSDMVTNGTVEKLRLGNENVIDLTEGP